MSLLILCTFALVKTRPTSQHLQGRQSRPFSAVSILPPRAPRSRTYVRVLWLLFYPARSLLVGDLPEREAHRMHHHHRKLTRIARRFAAELTHVLWCMCRAKETHTRGTLYGSFADFTRDIAGVLSCARTLDVVKDVVPFLSFFLPYTHTHTHTHIETDRRWSSSRKLYHTPCMTKALGSFAKFADDFENPSWSGTTRCGTV